MDVVFWSSDHPKTGMGFYRYAGPYKISHWISKYGYQSQVIDFIIHFSEDQLYTVSKKFITSKTLVLGISTTFMCYHTYVRKDGTTSRFPEHVENVAKKLKDEFPNLKIVLGGYGAGALYMNGIPDATVTSLSSSNQDLFLEYLEFLKNQGPRPIGTLCTTFAFENHTNFKSRIWYNTPRNITYKIENDDFKWRKNDCILEKESLPLDVSQGCIFACRFCNFPHLGKKKLDYIRGMNFIKDELIYNYENFKTVHYMILDDTFNDTTIKLNEFKKITDSLPFKITYTAYLRADLLQRFPDMIYILKESGLLGCVHGLESLHPHASNILGKAWSGKHAKDFIPKLYHDYWKKEVGQQLNFIIGLPEDDKKHLWETIKWAEENNLFGIHLHSLDIHSPERQQKDNNYIHAMSSELGRNPEKYGFKFDNHFNWYNKTWNKNQAIIFTKVLWKYLEKSSVYKINPWQLGNMSNIFNYDLNILLNTPRKNINFNDFNNRKQNEIYENYYYKLINI